MFKKIQTLLVLLQVLGVPGSISYLFQRWFMNAPHIVIWPRGGFGSLRLRRHSTDLIVFHQIFLWRELAFDVSGVPSVIVDLGGYTGLSAVFFALRYPGTRIIVVEPSTENLQVLRSNVSGYHRIEVVNAAVMGQSGTASILETSAPEHSFRFVASQESVVGGVRAVTIDELISDYGLDSIDILKMDIEGAEFDVFAHGGLDWLRLVACMAIEVHDNISPGALAAVRKAVAGVFHEVRSGEYHVFHRQKSI